MTNSQGHAKRSDALRRGAAHRYAGWSLALLASTALVAVPSALTPFGFDATALARGGDGGNATANDGTGGDDSDSGAGTAGTSYSSAAAGGGGGAGISGGAGGNGTSSLAGGAGGANRSDDVVFAGAISGSGAVVQRGTGTLGLTGANTYAGGTSIAAGTIQIAAASALGTGPLSLLGAGTLRASASFTDGRGIALTPVNGQGGGGIAVDANQTLTLTGVVSGSGALTKSGDGTLALRGANSFTGATTVAGGVLEVGGGSSLSDTARLLYGNNGFTGAVTAKDAFVRLDPGAATTASFTLESGSVLGGTATIGALAANAGSIVAPGYSPGTITVTGATAFNAGSTYAVDVTPDGQHDLITTNGPVTISSEAQVKIHATPGRYAPNSTYAILTTTATVTGQFGSVSSDFAFLKPTLSYDTHQIYLGLTYNERRFTDFARTRNQFALGAAAQDLGWGNRVFEALLTLPEGQVARAFERLDGEGHASLNTVIQQQSAYLRDAVGARLRQSGAGDDALGRAARAAGPASQAVEGDPGRTLWAQAYGGFGRRQGTGNAGAIASATGGMLAGLDVALGDAIRVGVIGGLGRSSTDVPSRDTSAAFSTYDVGAYASGRFGALALRGGFAQSWHEVSARRSVVFPGYSGSQSARYTVAASQAFGEVSTDVAVGAATLQPFAGLTYASLDGHRVREQGSPVSALSGTVRGQDVVYTSLGARAATQVALGEVVLTPAKLVGG